MSQSFLVVAADPVIGALVGELVNFAGYRPRYLSDDESPAGAIRIRPPFGVLLDASKHETEVTAALRAARDHHVLVVYFASSMSSAELRAYAEQRHAPWFALPNGPKLVSRVLSDAIAHADTPVEAPSSEDLFRTNAAELLRLARTDLGSTPPAITAALMASQRAQLLVCQAELVRRDNRMLRSETAELFAEATSSRVALREAVQRYATSLRSSGVTAQEARSVVKRLMFESAVTVADEHTADGVAHEALDWVSEVYAA